MTRLERAADQGFLCVREEVVEVVQSLFWNAFELNSKTGECEPGDDGNNSSTTTS